MPLPDKEQFTGSSVTEQGFKQAQNQLIDYIDSEVATSEFVDSKIIKVEDKLISFERGVNIFDKADALIGKYYNWENGLIGDAAQSFSAAKLIVIEPSTEYRVPVFYGQQFAFFDSNQKYISGKANAIADGFKITTPSNAKYIGMTVEVEYLNKMMLSKTSEFQEVYTPKRVNLNDLAVKSRQVYDLPSGIKSILGVYNVNIIDASNVISGKYIEWNTGREIPSSTHCVSGHFEVKPSTEYKTSNSYTQQFCFYDADFKYISGMAQVETPSFTFKTPSNAKYIRLTIPNSQLNSLVVTETTLFPSGGAYLPYQVHFKKLLVEPSQVNNLPKTVKEIVNINDLNILDLSTALENYYVNWENGVIGPVSGHVVTDYIDIKPATEYQTDLEYSQQFAFYDVNKKYVSGLVRPDDLTKTFTTPAGVNFARFTVPKLQIESAMITEKAVFPKTYQPYNIKIAKDLVILSNDIRITEIWVSADENDADPRVKFKGKNAIQLALDSITDATEKNRYIIRVKKGLYKITKATEFLGYRGYPAMILTKDHVDIVGQGENNTIVWAELPYLDEDIGASIDGNVYPRSSYQTVYDYSDDSIIKDITFIAKNLRYTIHIDNPNGAYASREFENVGFLFKGDKGSLTAMGCGTSSGEHTCIIGGRSLSDNNVPFASHNNIEFDTPSFWSFKSHNFTALKEKYFAYMQSDGSLLQDQLELIGCSFGGMAYVLGYVEVWLTGNTSLNHDSFNHAEWQITGYGNEPFLFENTVEGTSLRFKSNTVGASTSIRFDKSSSAYPVLIKNNQSNSEASLYTDNREFIDGYIVQDGSVGLAGQAWGCRDLSERIYLYDGGVNYTSLAKRLGNCSTLNKVLGVIVNGVMNTITFNKNYSSMTNAQIISEINSQLSGATADFYNYGRDYYPTITDVTENVFNTNTSYIPKGSVVTKSGGTVKLANANDKVYGVALDDIPVMQTTSEGVKKGQGRVLKRGYIYTNRSKAHFVLADVTPAVGTTFRIENGQLVASVNGSIRVDIDSDVVSINC